ncbi:MAG: Gldg family protein [Spirochaetales bacterium]|jgi:ABC-type uncharacterized transport system involved in gliding motility auxiliary subunit|nr:Gldg family protein [Spirochaetales bacterium]
MKTQLQWLRFAAYAAVIILINAALSTLFFRLDLTSRRIYSLSQASVRAVSELEEPLTIRIYISDNLPSPYNNLEQELRDIMTEYRIRANKFFNFSLHAIEPDGPGESERSQANRTDAQSYGIYPIQIQKIEQSEINLVNAFMGMVFIQGDLIETVPVIQTSGNLEYQITGTIRRMAAKTGALLAMPENLQIKLYLSQSLSQANREFRDYPENLEVLIQELNRQNYGRLSFSVLDPENPEPGEEGPDAYGLTPLTLNTGGGEQNVYASLVLESQGRYASLGILSRSLFGYTLASPEDLKPSLQGVIDRLTGTNPRIGYLADHGCPPFYGSYYGQSSEPEINNIRGLLSQNYDFVQVALSEGSIPEEIQTLLIAGPSEPFSDWEIFLLDQFLMKGNSLIFLLDTHTELSPEGEMAYYQSGPSYLPRFLNLDGFLAHYGFTLERSYVLDEQCFIQTQRRTDGSYIEIPLYFAPLVEAKQINQNSPLLWNIKGLIFLNASPLTLNSEPPSGAPPEALVSSSPTSWEMRENINLYNPMMITPPPESEFKSQVLTASAQGAMTSYFKDRPIPPRNNLPETGAGENLNEDLFTAPGFEAAPELIPQSSQSRIYLLGSSYLIKDNLIDAQGDTPNAMFIENLVDGAAGSEDFAMMRSKGQSYNPLRETSPGLKRFLQGFAIAVLPLLIGLFALFIWFRWSARKRRLESLFKDDKFKDELKNDPNAQNEQGGDE